MHRIKATEDGLCRPENAVCARPAGARGWHGIFTALFYDTMVGERNVEPCRFGQVSG